MNPLPYKPQDKAIKAYCEAMKRLHKQGVDHEGAVRSAFQSLLTDTARRRDWTLVPELASISHGVRVVPGGTLRDDSTLPRGYWEAKDTDDDLDAEILKKIARG